MLTRDFSPMFLGKQSVGCGVSKVKPQFDELLKEHQEILEEQSWREGVSVAGTGQTGRGSEKSSLEKARP